MVKKIKLKRKNKKSKKAVPRIAAMDSESKRWRIFHPKYKSGVYLLRPNNKQISPYARDLLRDHYEDILLPPNMLWIPDGGKHQSGMLSKNKKNYIDKRGKLRGKYFKYFDVFRMFT